MRLHIVSKPWTGMEIAMQFLRKHGAPVTSMVVMAQPVLRLCRSNQLKNGKG